MSAMLDPRLSFDRFVVGPNNQLAAAASRRAAEAPGTSYNPLVIHGPPGLGKTHLLNAIAQLTYRLQPGLLVRHTTADALVDTLSDALADGGLERFRREQAAVDLLLLDDLQSIAGKQRTQEELLRLWDGLIGRDCQLVIVCDRPPAEIPDLDPRLASRLTSGLTLEIGPPEEATRLHILRQIAEERGWTPGEELLRALARLPIANVRELQGAVQRIAAVSELEGRTIAPDEVNAILGIEESAAGVPQDEFGAFLSDISTAVAAVVETSPWRRRLAEAILRWEGEGYRTRRLDEALEADSAPDVDALLDGFSRDVARLREIRASLSIQPDDPDLLTDPDRVQEAEALLAPRAPEPEPIPELTPAASHAVRSDQVEDAWFLDPERLAIGWFGLDERIIEEPV